MLAALAPSMKQALEVGAAATLLPAVVVTATEVVGGSALVAGGAKLASRAALELRVAADNNPASSFVAGAAYGFGESMLKPDGVPPGTMKAPAVNKSFTAGYRVGKFAGAVAKVAAKLGGVDL